MNIKKIKDMEEILVSHRKIIDDFNDALDKFKESQKYYEKLSNYYSSSAYMDDLEESNQTEISPNISQGIYSEDLVFDLIGDNYQTAVKMLEIGLDIIKKH
ncbi:MULTISPECIES: DUF4298 domain-containing protein [Anaerococcus]|nr:MULTISPECIES: DUF4298 domain-containing protein [Anaerococcus]MDY3005978.1 DUF4298 domain-containing protein [Anaerococcus porci]